MLAAMLVILALMQGSHYQNAGPYLVEWSGGRSVRYVSLVTGAAGQIEAPFDLSGVLANHGSPLLHLVGKEAESGLDVALCDLRTGRIVTRHDVLFDVSAPLWSPRGEYAALILDARIRFVKSDSLMECWSQPDTCRAVVELPGHPLGPMWVLQWLADDRVLYGTGVGELRCYGLYDLPRKANHAIGCCLGGGTEVVQLSYLLSTRKPGSKVLTPVSERYWLGKEYALKAQSCVVQR